MTKMTTSLGAGALGLAVLLLTSQADASSITVTDYDLAGKVSYVRTDGSTTSQGSARTALLDITLEDGTEGAAFCVDLDHTIGRGTYGDVDVYAPSEAAASEARHFSAAASIAQRWTSEVAEMDRGAPRDVLITAVQAAIWNVVYGDTLTIVGFDGNDPAEAVYEQIMAEWAAGKYGGAGNTKVIDLKRNQDQLITATSVPEPTAALLFGFGALIVSRRTKRD